MGSYAEEVVVAKDRLISLPDNASGFPQRLYPEVIKRALRVGGGSVFEYTRSPGELQARASTVIESVRSGWLRLRTRVLPLSEVRQVHEQLEGRATTGKLLLRVTSSLGGPKSATPFGNCAWAIANGLKLSRSSLISPVSATR
jgi:hypothetical protein